MVPGIAELLSRVAQFNQDRRLVRIRSPLADEALLVRRMRVAERLSAPYSIQLELLSPYLQLELKELIGQPVSLHIALTSGGERQFHGYVRQFGRAGSDGALVRYEAEVVPWLWFLGYRSNCRVFQDLNVLDIVQRVFAEYGEVAKFRLEVETGRYQPVNYCVQYNESDLDFVGRLLEDAGIYYHFEHDDEGHTLVLADDSTQSKPIVDGSEQVAFHLDNGTLGEDVIAEWRARRSVVPVAFAIKSFDFKQPSTPLAVRQTNTAPRGVLPELEAYAYDGAARYTATPAGDGLAGLRAEVAGWKSKLFEGEGTSREMAPGRWFELTGHPEHDQDEQADRRFFVISANHEAVNNFPPELDAVEGCVFSGMLSAIRRKIPYRPERLTPRAKMGGPQTATVVGPPGEELFADRYGRVKVQFHWDRDGGFDERSSCWVRVASPWAGSGMGGVSPPRIGQEVVVDFLDGNPDRPLITGRVFNEFNMPPFGNETSGLRSKTLKGGGYNEVTMHDGAGGELLNMQAERNMATLVKNDQTSTINNNKTTSVAVDHTESVGSNQSTSVGANQSLKVGGNRDTAITGNRSATVQGNDLRAVTGTSTSTVTGAVAQTYSATQTRQVASDFTDTVGGNWKSALTGNYTGTITGNWVDTVTGTAAWNVTGATSETLLGGRTVTVTGADTRSVNGAVADSNTGARTVSVTGDLDQGATGTCVLHAASDMSVLSGSKVDLGVGGSGISIDGGSIMIAASGSTIKIDGSGVTVNGAKINLNC